MQLDNPLATSPVGPVQQLLLDNHLGHAIQSKGLPCSNHYDVSLKPGLLEQVLEQISVDQVIPTSDQLVHILVSLEQLQLPQWHPNLRSGACRYVWEHYLGFLITQGPLLS